MDKLATWVVAGLLAYIGFVLTSIDAKLDSIDHAEAQVAVLNQVETQSYTASTSTSPAVPVDAALYTTQSPLAAAPLYGALFATAAIFLFIAWHVSRIYHEHRWAKRVLRHQASHYRQPHVSPPAPGTLHPDQDCILDDEAEPYESGHSSRLLSRATIFAWR